MFDPIYIVGLSILTILLKERCKTKRIESPRSKNVKPE